MVSDSENNLCLFRQIEAMNDVLDQYGELPKDSDITRALSRPEEFGCRVGCCAIRGENLIDYIHAASRPVPRDELDRRAAPSCAILDIVHQSATDLAETYNMIRTFGEQQRNLPDNG